MTMRNSALSGAPDGVAMRAFGNVYIDTIERRGGSGLLRHFAERDITDFDRHSRRPYDYSDELEIESDILFSNIMESGRDTLSSESATIDFSEGFSRAISSEIAVNINIIGAGNVNLESLDNSGFQVSGIPETEFCWTAISKGIDLNMKSQLLIQKFNIILKEEGILPKVIFNRNPTALEYEKWSIIDRIYNIDLPTEEQFNRLIGMDSSYRLNHDIY
ncbi:MAG: hypothetical protein ACLFSQ_10510 [Candidatus Zixiibacteriota bacterium]